MLCIKTSVAPSPIQGLGLFAGEFVPQETVIWRFTPGFDHRFAREEILAFPEMVQKYLARYAFLSKKSALYVLPVGEAIYFNHADSPTCESRHEDTEEEVVTYALRDIRPGEELTDDYGNFEDSGYASNLLYEFAHSYNLPDELTLVNKLKI